MDKPPVKIIDSKQKYLRTVPIRFGIRCTATPYTVLHVHDCTELWYALHGEAIHKVGSETFIQTAGSCVAVPAFVPHSIDITEANGIPIFASINISDNALIERGYKYFSYHDNHIHFEGMRFPIYSKLPDEKISHANSIIHMLSIEFSDLQNANLDTLLALYVDFLRLFDAEECSFKLTSSLKERTDSILKATQYMSANIREKITIETLCKAANMSRSRFCENFTKITDFSPMDYLLNIRMSLARRLFLLRGKSLSEVAKAIGASDNAHLCRTFKKFYGMTLSEYKKLYQTSQQLNDLETRKRNSTYDSIYDFFSTENNIEN